MNIRLVSLCLPFVLLYTIAEEHRQDQDNNDINVSESQQNDIDGLEQRVSGGMPTFRSHT
eukprot:9577758-Ditylum_brightwellii.AAC.1